MMTDSFMGIEYQSKLKLNCYDKRQQFPIIGLPANLDRTTNDIILQVLTGLQAT